MIVCRLDFFASRSPVRKLTKKREARRHSENSEQRGGREDDERRDPNSLHILDGVPGRIGREPGDRGTDPRTLPTAASAAAPEARSRSPARAASMTAWLMNPQATPKPAPIVT